MGPVLCWGPCYISSDDPMLFLSCEILILFLRFHILWLWTLGTFFSLEDKWLFLHSPEREKSKLPLLPSHLSLWIWWPLQEAISGIWMKPPRLQLSNTFLNSLSANYSYNAVRQVRVYLIFRGWNLLLVELNVSLSASGEPAQAIHQTSFPIRTYPFQNRNNTSCSFGSFLASLFT